MSTRWHAVAVRARGRGGSAECSASTAAWRSAAPGTIFGTVPPYPSPASKANEARLWKTREGLIQFASQLCERPRRANAMLLAARHRWWQPLPQGPPSTTGGRPQSWQTRNFSPVPVEPPANETGGSQSPVCDQKCGGPKEAKEDKRWEGVHP